MKSTDCIQFNLKDRKQGSVVQSKLFKSMPLSKVMEPCRRRLGLQASQATLFTLDGVCLAPDDTAEKLGLEGGGLIDVAVCFLDDLSAPSDLGVVEAHPVRKHNNLMP